MIFNLSLVYSFAHYNKEAYIWSDNLGKLKKPEDWNNLILQAFRDPKFTPRMPSPSMPDTQKGERRNYGLKTVENIKEMNLSKILTIALIAAAPGLLGAQTIVTKSPHSNVHKKLLAKHGNAKDQIRLTEHNTFIDLIDDDIEPELDIYTEGWNSKSVNPFAGMDVPNTAVIDVTGYAMPCPGRVTSNYGYRPRFRRMHKGIDLQIKSNDTIYAAFDGKVRMTNFERKGYGYYVIIRHPNNLETVYGHLNKFLVKPEQVVKAGQPIALGGSTGRSTGPHLHFETRFMGYAINPAAIFDFANHTTHTDTYTFSKQTYQQPRNYAPAHNAEMTAQHDNPYKSNKKSAKRYTVRKGDSLSKIARIYGLSTTRLARMNGIKVSSKIRPGQKLRVR